MPRAGTSMLMAAEPGFSPPDIAGLVLWLAASSLGLADTDPVTSWPDLSDGGHDGSAPGPDPTFQTNEVNGHPAVQFALGGSQYISIADHADLKLDGDSTAFLVMKQVVSGNCPYLSKSPGGTAGAYYLYAPNTTKPQVDRPFVEGGVEATNALGTAAYRMLTVRINGTALEHRLDGAANGGDTIAVGTATTDALEIARFGGSAYGTINVAEILIYNVALSDGDRDLVEAYLMAKYAV